MGGTGPTRAARQTVTARAAGRCERCGRSAGWPLHHRKPRGMGGSSLPEINDVSNLLLLCLACHEWIERNRTVSYDNGWLVKREHGPEQVPVLLAGLGWRLLGSNGEIELTERTA